MRRYKKSELLETADMLAEANDIIGRLCASSPERALDVLGQCQESAILLGNLIESKGEQYTELVGILESYCENIYQISTALSDEEQVRKLSKKIQRQLLQLQNRIRHEIPEDKKEVVFFPYKASMWDSLESVWQAADAEEDTDAYVVPIPYFDKNPDGTFREMHYEGNEYPDYVPITDWETYDFEERRPDIMFIHNPYDAYNYVTSVHPRFYSSNLKKFTEKLVYIPYFIIGEVNPDDNVAVERVKHFCINEAVNNADKVIVQSEDMRQVYIEVLTREAGGSKEARAYWEEKIDGSGSPKVDKVLKTKKEDLVIPEEWMKIIKKPDGSFKKIIFYNTSVTALLQHDEKMLKKMESVFEIFSEYKRDMALLWRPHPLLESTLISMRPHLWEKYKKIRDKYIDEGWGIYDDSADMDRAVVLSDAYYGDESSVLQLYKKTGKLYMVQDVETFRRKDHLLPMSNGIIYNNEMWFVGLNDNRIYRLNLETFKAIVEYRIPWEDVSVKKLQYRKIIKYKSKIILIPELALKIAVYDMEKREMRYIDYVDKKCGTGAFFHGGVLVESKLYLIPTSYDRVICIDVEKETVIDRSDSLIKLTGQEEGKRAYAVGGIAKEGKYILFTMQLDNKLVKYDIESNRIEILTIEALSDGGTGIFSDSENIWIIHKSQKKIERYNKRTMKVDVLDQFPFDFLDSDWNFYQGHVYKESLFLLPRETNMCLKVSLLDGKIEPLKLENKIIAKDNNYWDRMYYTSIFEADNKLMISDYKGYLYIYHSEDKVEKRKIEVDNDSEMSYFLGQFDYEENNMWDTLEDFLDYVLNGIHEICELQVKGNRREDRIYELL